MPPLHEVLRAALPRLTADNYRVSSPATWEYNCDAWGAGVTDAWWWPLPGRYWPSGVPREETVDAFVAAFATVGYGPLTGQEPEPGVERIALYTRGGVPLHVARQLSSGWWTSKLGPSVDIEHATAEAVGGGEYGEVVLILDRKLPV
jgi:hypothetical protein